MRFPTSTALFIILVVSATVASASVNVFTVDTAVDENDGIAVNAVSLRDAIDASGTDDIINFAAELEDQTITLMHGELLIDHPLQINGPGARKLVVDADGGSRVFKLTHISGEVKISGLTITGGQTTGDGGGIFNSGGAKLSLLECTITENKGGSGGGISNQFLNTSAIIERCTFSNNSADQPTGFHNSGGVDNFGGATMLLSNCTISGNVALNEGGGVANDGAGSSMRMINCTVTNNEAFAGSGFLNSGTASGVLGNTIIAGNELANSADFFGRTAVTSLGGNYIAHASDASGVTDAVLGDQVGSAEHPLENVLEPLSSANEGPTDTHALIFPSKAVGKANDLFTAENFPSEGYGDQRGAPRVGRPDIGAYEAAPSLIYVTTTGDELDGVSFGAGISLREAMDAISPAGYISLPSGSYGLTSGTLVVDRALTIGGGGAKRTTIDAMLTDGAFVIEPGAALNLSTVTVTNGAAASDGGAILNNSGTLSLFACHLTGNGAFNGGAICSRGTEAEPATTGILYSTLDNNITFTSGSSGGLGGGVYNSRYSSLHVSNSTISTNISGDGGGIFNLGDASLHSCTMVANSASDALAGSGGVSSAAFGSCEVADTIIQLNTSAHSNFRDIYTDSSFTSDGGNYIGVSSSGDFGFLNGVLGDFVGTPASPLQQGVSTTLSDNGGETPTNFPIYPGPIVDTGKEVLTEGGSDDQRSISRPFGEGFDIGAVEWTPYVYDGSPDPGLCEVAEGISIDENAGYLYVSYRFTSTSEAIVVLFSTLPGEQKEIGDLGVTAAAWDYYMLIPDDFHSIEFYDSSNSVPENLPPFYSYFASSGDDRFFELFVDKSTLGGRRVFISFAKINPDTGVIDYQYPSGNGGSSIEREEYLPVITGYKPCATNLGGLRDNVVRKLLGQSVFRSVPTDFDVNGDGVNDVGDARYTER
ncbi:MAG: right-handed parallel beta-helix repeat-containing protein [Candidatus Sumerlaeota bacterium]